MLIQQTRTTFISTWTYNPLQHTLILYLLYNAQYLYKHPDIIRVTIISTCAYTPNRILKICTDNMLNCGRHNVLWKTKIPKCFEMSPKKTVNNGLRFFKTIY